MRRFAAALALCVALISVSACTNRDSPPVPPSPTGVTYPLEPIPTEARTVDTAHVNPEIHVVQKKDRIPADRKPVLVTRDKPDPTSSDIQIAWSYGNCGKPNRETDVYVDEGASSVVIDVWDDTRMDLPPGTACAGVGFSGSWTVHLSKPLGTRTVDFHSPLFK